MAEYKTIGVIGGTGKAGKYIVTELLANGFGVRMLVRDTTVSVIPPNDRLLILKGDVRDYQSLAELFKGCHAVISSLGQTRDTATPMFAGSTELMFQALAECNLRRIIMVVGLNLEVDGDQKSKANLASTAYMKNTYPEFSAEKQKIVNMLKSIDLDWTVVRIPFVMDSDKMSQVLIDLHDCLGTIIRAMDLAVFLVEQLDEVKYIHKYPFIASVE